jgi:hypothetical protein
LRQKIMYKTPGYSQKNNFSGGGGTFGSNVTYENSKPFANALPLYNTPPSILFCDETLEIGQTKSCRNSSKLVVYELLLPSVLPPSHRGKVVKFQYKLLIGIQKNMKTKVSKVISIPFRFLNRTNADGSRPIYEILNPVIQIKDNAKISELIPNGVSFMNSPTRLLILI